MRHIFICIILPSRYMSLILLYKPLTQLYETILATSSDGHDHDFSRSPIVDQIRRSFSNDRRSSIFLLDHFLTIVDHRSCNYFDRRSRSRSSIADRGSRSYYYINV